MQAETIDLGSLLLCLSDVLDMVSPRLAAHQQRVAFAADELCRTAGLPLADRREVFAAALLHDIGALTPEEKIGIRENRIAGLDRHCALGEGIIAGIPAISASGHVLRHHHRQWHEWREPGDPRFALKAQILALADSLERSIDRDRYILHQSDLIAGNIEAGSGERFQPRVVDLFREAALREEFWLDLTSPRLYAQLGDEGPFHGYEVDISQVFSFADLFRVIIDFRSQFTATHSTGIAASATALAAIFGFTEAEQAVMEVAGFLHDLGKLSVPNRILEKPGQLDADEFAIMRRHTYYTYKVLGAVRGLEQIAAWGAFHHERLDGSGYPFHLAAAELTLGSRIMAVADVFTAVAEDRPYRPGMDREQIEEILRDLAAAGKLDGRVVEALLDNYDGIIGPMHARQAEAMNFYRERFADQATGKDYGGWPDS